MALHPLAGQPAPASVLVDVSRLLKAYEQDLPDVTQPTQKVAFGTSGHRGSSLKRSFNRAHILCITQAVCEYRASQGITGVMYVGRDSHGLSAPAQDTALEVLAAHGVNVRYAAQDALTPTPVISHAILTANRGKPAAKADGLIITPSHNPPEDGGIKYNPPHGGPADTNVTRWIEDRANELLRDGGKTVKRSAWNSSAHIQAYDFVTPYVEDLRNVLDFTALSQSGLRLGADPLGGSSVGYWDAIAARYRINIDVVNRTVDPTFGFMPLDHDGKIRMDCSSPHAMANLVRLKDRYDIAFGNDADSDRHGIVTRSGLMNPNHFLAVAIADLFGHRGFGPQVRVGKTLVSSAMIDRVARDLQRTLVEVPVGFKWFVDGLLDGTLGFGGEESAGASFLRLDGTAWTTDKDGIILDLLAADILARTGKDPSQQYAALEQRFGSPRYVRLDQACTPAQKALFKKLTPESVTASALAGEPITARLTRAPGNNADIGGLKVVTENGWFAARPSGTEDVYKIYAESFLGEDHLKRIVDEAAAIVTRALG